MSVVAYDWDLADHATLHLTDAEFRGRGGIHDAAHHTMVPVSLVLPANELNYLRTPELCQCGVRGAP